MQNKSINDFFEGLTDSRSARNQRHPFLSIITLGILAVIAGIDSFSGIGDFAEAHLEELSRVLDLPNGAPSHDTIRRVFDLLDPVAFHQCFMDFTRAIAQQQSQFIAIDGKEVCNGPLNPLRLVSAWCSANQVTLAQTKVHDKSNEITAIPELLKLLDLSGTIVTIDAMGCQKDIAKAIIDQEADYVLALKDNHKTLCEDVAAYFNDLKLFDGYYWQELDKGHGRIEQRECYVTDAIDYVQQHHSWSGLRSIALVIAKRTIKDKTTTERRYYISSLPPNAELIARAARMHWEIENKLHWRLDVIFNEDKACIRNENAAENMALLRKWALNLLTQHKGKSSIKSLQRKASMSFKFLLSLLNQVFHA